ncbi:MAG TPA: hypothetical protein VFG07_01115 [Thermoplasmata archaeon]|nr:hypothetical protein [Thermoplasmata archaeon]
MAWTLYAVPTEKKSELDALLRDDQISRQSQKVRDAPSAGGPAATLYVLLEGSEEALRRADTLFANVGTKPAEAESIYRRLKEEEENASSGMGLFFTE